MVGSAKGLILRRGRLVVLARDPRRVTRDRPPFGDMDYQRATRPLRKDITVVTQYLEPQLDRPFRQAHIASYRPDATIAASRPSVGMDHQVKEQPDRAAHCLIVTARTRHH